MHVHNCAGKWNPAGDNNPTTRQEGEVGRKKKKSLIKTE
jgi:hypothetical protein